MPREYSFYCTATGVADLGYCIVTGGAKGEWDLMCTDVNAFVYELCIWASNNSFGIDAASSEFGLFELVVSGVAWVAGI